MTAQRPPKAGHKSCRLCGGTGLIYLSRSWFINDGYTRAMCTRVFEGDKESRAFQRRARARVAEWGALIPRAAAVSDRQQIKAT